MQKNQIVSDLARLLAPAGLNMVAIVPVARLEQRWIDAVPLYGSVTREKQNLLVVGNAGPDFWAACQRSNHTLSGLATQADPVDNFARKTTESALHQLFDLHEFRLLYPLPPSAMEPACQISLQAIGELTGWHQPSPLGIGINPEFGLWFAYRTLVLLDLDLDDKDQPNAQSVYPPPQVAASVCEECETLDCIVTCPAQALTPGAQPNMQSCVNYRLQDNSACANRCLARNACPVGVALSYTAEQTDHHYSVSLDSIKRWVKI